jgi:hypothetical protein
MLKGVLGRTVPRPRRAVPSIVFLGIRPVIRYSEWRDAWILRGIGEDVGPVFVRRGVDRRPRSVDRKALAERARKAQDDRLGVPEQVPAPEPGASRPELRMRPRPTTRLQRRAEEQASARPAQPAGADAAVAAPTQAPRATKASPARATRQRSHRRSRRSAGGALSASPRALLVVFGVVVAATAVTLILIDTGGSTPPKSTVRLTAGVIEVPVPPGWKREAPTAARTFGLLDGVALGTKPSGTLIVGRASSTSGLLPEQLSATLARTPAPQLVTLGGAQYYRYLDVTPRAGGGSESVYTLHTTAGTVLAVCVAHRPDPSLAARCEHVLGAARLTTGTTLANPEPSYAAAFTAVIHKLNQVRTSATHRLSNAQDSQQQASAAATLAGGHLQAAAALERLNAGPASGVNASVATAIRALGSAYRSLGQAAARSDTAAYDAARAEVSRRTTDLNSGIERLRALGYPVQTTPA